jgi:S1-C subfamily serine protease
MKALLFFVLLTSLLPVRALLWTRVHELTLEENLTAFAQKIPRQMRVVGRTGSYETVPAIVLSENGHLLAPLIPSIDQSDAPYLLYLPDGSRLSLTTVTESPKRSLALLKIEDPSVDLAPVQPAPVGHDTVVLPTLAPVASLGELPSLFVDHLQIPSEDENDTFRLDSIFSRPGTAVFDPSGFLIGTTLKARENHTPVLRIRSLLVDLPELDGILAEPTEPLPLDLPDAPAITEEELEDLAFAPLTKSRQRFIQSTHPSPLPCVLISNESTQATHSAIGTIVRSDGLILTKASELGPSFRVRYGGQSYPGVLLSTDEETDLALVGIAESNMPVVRWSDRALPPGATVAAPVLLQESTADMVSEPTSYPGTFSHPLEAGRPTVHATSQVTSLGLTSEQTDSRVTIAALQADTPAYQSGLSPGDVMTKIDETPIKDRFDLTSFLDQQEVGNLVTLTVVRADQTKEFEVELIAPRLLPPATGISLEDGIPMIPSVRRAPFPATLVHTAPLNAWDCGSPLFDRRGQALGLNIAAVAPARTLALPPSEVRKALDRLLAQTRAF